MQEAGSRSQQVEPPVGILSLFQFFFNSQDHHYQHHRGHRHHQQQPYDDEDLCPLVGVVAHDKAEKEAGHDDVAEAEHREVARRVGGGEDLQ